MIGDVTDPCPIPSQTSDKLSSVAKTPRYKLYPIHTYIQLGWPVDYQTGSNCAVLLRIMPCPTPLLPTTYPLDPVLHLPQLLSPLFTDIRHAPSLSTKGKPHAKLEFATHVPKRHMVSDLVCHNISVHCINFGMVMPLIVCKASSFKSVSVKQAAEILISGPGLSRNNISYQLNMFIPANNSQTLPTIEELLLLVSPQIYMTRLTNLLPTYSTSGEAQQSSSVEPYGLATSSGKAQRNSSNGCI